MSALKWKKPKRDDDDLAERKIWESECGGYRVVHSKPKFGSAPAGYIAMVMRMLPTKRWASLQDDGQGRCIRHKSLEAAQAVCEKDNG